MIEQLLDGLSKLIAGNPWLSPVFALLAGVLASFLPCSLSGVPLVIGYVGGAAGNDPRRAFRLSLVFAAGSAATYTVLGIVAAVAGVLIGTASSWWYIALGVLMVLMALQTFEIVHIIPATYLVSKNTKRGYAGALIAGVLAGVFSTPCATPVLVVLLAVVAQKASLVWGIALLLMYSIGHSALVIAAGTSVGFVKKLTASDRYGRLSRVLRIIAGIIILGIAFYMFYLGF